VIYLIFSTKVHKFLCSDAIKVINWFANFNMPHCLNNHENLCREVITNIFGLPFGIHRPKNEDFEKQVDA